MFSVQCETFYLSFKGRAHCLEVVPVCGDLECLLKTASIMTVMNENPMGPNMESWLVSVSLRESRVAAAIRGGQNIAKSPPSFSVDGGERERESGRAKGGGGEREEEQEEKKE